MRCAIPRLPCVFFYTDVMLARHDADGFFGGVLQEIMTDPVMQSILQQAQGNPQALQDHMKNPTVRTKIMKLINAGIIRTR